MGKGQLDDIIIIIIRQNINISFIPICFMLSYNKHKTFEVGLLFWRNKHLAFRNLPLSQYSDIL